MPTLTPEKIAQMDEKLRQMRGGGVQAASAGALAPDRKAAMDAKLQAIRSGQDAAPPKPSFLQNLVSGVAKPFAKAAASAQGAIEGTGYLGGALLSRLAGNDAAYQKQLGQAQAATTAQRDYGIFGKVRPVGVNQETGQNLSLGRSVGDIVGTGAEIGSYLAPIPSTSGKTAFQAMKAGGWAAAKPVLGKALMQGAEYGALAGGLASGGRALSEGDNLKTGLIRTGVGATAGGVVGAAIPALSFGTRVAAKGVADTAKAAIKAITPQARNSAEYLTAQASGLSPKTVRNITEDPSIADDILKGNPVENRAALGERAKNAFDQKLDELGETGSAYNSIRESQAKLALNRTDSGLPDFVDDVAKKFGITIDENGTIEPLTAATKLKPGDAAALQKFLDQYGRAETADEFLNARAALDDLANWGRDPARTKASENIARVLRREYDTAGKEAIPGLAELDATYGPQREFVDNMRKLLFDKNGELKDNAISTLTNSTNVNNAGKLAKLEKLMPGITKEVNIVKAIDDVAAASGQKTGTYFRGALGGAGLLSMNPVLLLTSFFGSPQNFIKAIQAYGYANQGKFATDLLVNKIVSGATLTAGQQAVVEAVIQAAIRGARSVSGLEAGNAVSPAPR